MAKKDAAPKEAKPEGDVTEKKKGKSLFWLLLIPMVLVMLGAGGWIALSQYPVLYRTAQGISSKQHAEGGEKKAEEGKEEEEGEQKGESKEEYGVFLEIPDLIVNPTGTDGQRFLLISVGLETKEEPVLEEIKTKDIVIRDAIINTLSQKPVPYLADIREREKIKEELRQRMNKLLQHGKITRLYFTQYVLQ